MPGTPCAPTHIEQLDQAPNLPSAMKRHKPSRDRKGAIDDPNRDRKGAPPRFKPPLTRTTFGLPPQEASISKPDPLIPPLSRAGEGALEGGEVGEVHVVVGVEVAGVAVGQYPAVRAGDAGQESLEIVQIDVAVAVKIAGLE